MTPLVHAKFSIADYHKMIEVGVFDNRSVEFLNGEILEMSPSGKPHWRVVFQISRMFGKIAAEQGAVCLSQSGLELTFLESEPEPDFMLLREDAGGVSEKAAPEDVILLVEVAESSLRRDREIKLPLYARAGIAEFWIVNLIDDCIEVYRQPNPESAAFLAKSVHRRGERFVLSAFPDFEVAVDAILPRIIGPEK